MQTKYFYISLLALIAYSTIHSMERLQTPVKNANDEALYYADWDDSNTVYTLLEQGVDPNTKDNGSGMSLLHYAIKNGNIALSETLLNHPKFIPVNAISEGYTSEGSTRSGEISKYVGSPFEFTLKYNQSNIAKYISQLNGIEANKLLDIYINHGSDATIDVLTNILAMNVNREKLSQLLLNATKRKQIKLITLLLKQKDININYTKQGYDDRSALYIAAHHTNLPILKLLIDHGAEFGQALCAAIQCGKKHNAQFLIEKGAPLTVKISRGITLLGQAIWQTGGQTCAQLIQLLLNSGADVNEKVDKEGNTPLCLVVCRPSSCHHAITVLLAQKNIDVDIKNNKNKTPLDILYEGHGGSAEDRDYMITLIKKHKENNTNQ